MFDSGANCFLNALVREFPQWVKAEMPKNIKDSEHYDACYRFDLNGGQQLILPLLAWSSFGRSYFDANCYLNHTHNQTYNELDFNQLLNQLNNHPEIFEDAKFGVPKVSHLRNLIARSAESQINIKTMVAHRQQDLEHLFRESLSFIDSEQSLLVGHSVHPCPKARSGFNTKDAQIYGPEFANQFQLNWFAADKSILYIFSGSDKPIEDYCKELIESDAGLRATAEQLPPNYLVIPCHPWQAQQWKQNTKLKRYFETQQLIELGPQGKQWRATSSLRSLYQAETPWMLKFSVSTQLTNSIRHLQPEEMIRGQVIEKVLSSPKAQQLNNELPHFSIMREPISLALKDDSGKALDSTAIIWRENPFYSTRQDCNNTEVLSGLLQDLPNKADNRLSLRLKQKARQSNMNISELGQSFLTQFLDVVIKPIIIAQAKYGLLFGAHQQNIVIQLDEDLMPVRTFFRDCQGTGFSALAKALYGEALLSDTNDSGNFFEDDTVIHLFTYYLLINSCFNTISSLTLTNIISESTALDIYKQFLLALKVEPLDDTRVINYLLESKDIWSKGNFRCNLHAINENTMNDPFLIYHPLRNPLHPLQPNATNAA